MTLEDSVREALCAIVFDGCIPRGVTTSQVDEQVTVSVGQFSATYVGNTKRTPTDFAAFLRPKLLQAIAVI